MLLSKKASQVLHHPFPYLTESFKPDFKENTIPLPTLMSRIHMSAGIWEIGGNTGFTNKNMSRRFGSSTTPRTALSVVATKQGEKPTRPRMLCTYEVHFFFVLHDLIHLYLWWGHIVHTEMYLISCRVIGSTMVRTDSVFSVFPRFFNKYPCPLFTSSILVSLSVLYELFVYDSEECETRTSWW